MMEIDIVIPWGADGNLGGAYNRTMSQATGWVCFQDHDILQLNPNWYKMLIGAAKRLGPNAGWITGVTNAIACKEQLAPGAPQHDDVMGHMDFARQCYQAHGEKLVQIDPKLVLPFSGFLLMTHKQAWVKAGGFMDGFLGVDNDYFRKLIKNDYGVYVMPGLYVYHIYRKKKRWSSV